MLHVITWIVVLGLLGLWSLAAWAVHAVGTWTVANAGNLGGAAAGASGLQLPQWLSSWVPPGIADGLSAGLAELGPWVAGVLQSVPALEGGVSVAVWVLWGIGAFLLLGLGAAASAVVALWRRR